MPRFENQVLIICWPQAGRYLRLLICKKDRLSGVLRGFLSKSDFTVVTVVVVIQEDKVEAVTLEGVLWQSKIVKI